MTNSNNSNRTEKKKSCKKVTAATTDCTQIFFIMPLAYKSFKEKERTLVLIEQREEGCLYIQY